MRFWRLLFGRRGAGERAEIAPPPAPASNEADTPEPGAADSIEVSAPAAKAPAGPGGSGLGAALTDESAAEPTGFDATSGDHAGDAIDVGDDGREGFPGQPETAADAAGVGASTAFEGAVPEPDIVVGEAGPEPDISPMRLDAALQRLRQENPASSGETPSDPSD